MDNTSQPNIIRPWLDRTGRKAKWLAKQIDTHPDTLTRYATAKLTIPRAVAIAIQTVTEGGITLEDWGLNK